MTASKPPVPAHAGTPSEVKSMESSTTSNATVAQLRSFAAGGVGGVCAVVVGHPFDLVKVRMQTAQKGVYSGAMDVVKRTVAREGLVRVSTFIFWFGGWMCGMAAYACV